MPILGCGAEMARLMEVSDDDIAVIEDTLAERLALGVPRAEAQRQAVAEAIAQLEDERSSVHRALREQHPDLLQEEPAPAPLPDISQPPALPSAPKKREPIPREVADGVARALNRMGLKRLQVVESIDELPAAGQQKIRSEGLSGVRGLYDQAGDTVYLIRNGIHDTEEALFVAMHEAFHRGLRNTLGDGVVPILQDIYAKNEKVRDLAGEYMRLHGVGQVEAVEEVLADLAGSGNIQEVNGWDRLLNYIRDFLDKVAKAAGVNMEWTDDDIRDLVAGARGAGMRDGEVGGQAERAPSAGGGTPLSRGPTQRSIMEPNAWNMPEPTRTDRAIYELQDGRVDLKRVQEAITAAAGPIEQDFDARLAETLYPGRVAKRSDDFLKVEVKPLLEAMARNEVGMDELSDFLLARHAPERNAQVAKVNPDLQDGGAGTNSQGELMTTAAAEVYMERLDPARRTLLGMLARQVDAITKGTRDILVGEGLEKQDTIDAWTGAYQHYVPLFKEEGDGGVPHPQGQGFTVKGSASKRSTGSTKEVTNVLAHVLMQREAAITRAEKNRVGLALYGLALSHPNRDFWSTIRPNMSEADIARELRAMGVEPEVAEDGMRSVPTLRTVDPATGKAVDRPNPMYKNLPGAITLKVNGEDRVLLLNTESERGLRMAENLKNLDGLTRLDLAGSIVGKSTRWLASVNTQYNPAFGIVNLGRDTLGAAVNIGSTPLRGKALRVLADTAPALSGIARHVSGKDGGEWGKLYEQFQQDGGQTGFKEMFRGANERSQAIEKELQRLETSGRLSPARAAHAALELLDGFNTTMENGVRLAAYKSALDNGMSRPMAAKLARELTVDFNRKGRAGRELGPLYAFFNASLQGTARTIETLKGPTGRQVVLGGLALGVVQAMMLAAAGFDEDELAEFTKARSFIIPTGDKRYVAIPLPLGLHVLPNTGRVLTELALGDRKDVGKKVVNAVGEIAGAFNPLGGGNIFTADGALKTIAPTLADPVIELIANRNFAGNTIEKRYDDARDARPGFTRAKEATQRSTTGQAYIGISKVLNTLMGGDDYTAGLASPSPEQVRYIAQTVGGGVLRELEKTINLVVPADNQREPGSSAIPLAGRFVGEVDDRQVQQSRFARNTQRLEKLESSMKAAEQAGDGAALREMLKRNPDARFIEAGNEIQSEITKLNRLAVQTVSNPEQIRKIDKARYESQRALNQAIRRLEEREAPTLAQRLRKKVE